MPRIGPELLDSVVYLYPSVEDAEDGRHVGGTGFLASVPEAFAAYLHYQSGEVDYRSGRIITYVVTNSHVIREGQSPVVRLNLSDGSDILPLEQSAWVHHPDGDDIAVAQIAVTASGNHIPTIGLHMFFSEENMQFNKLGVGDEVFFLGRFVTDNGRQRNSPMARFGNLAMLATERVPNSRGVRQESFLVDARSLSGHSGSPVFIHVPARYTTSAHMDAYMAQQGMMSAGWPTARDEVHLLGMVWGHVPDYKRVLGAEHVPLLDEWYVEQNTGVMGVVPAWKIVELLKDQRLVEMRKDETERRREEEKDEVTGVFDAAHERPYTKDDFVRDLKKVSRKRASRPGKEKSGT